jgi:hypothetical protein
MYIEMEPTEDDTYFLPVKLFKVCYLTTVSSPREKAKTHPGL